MRGFNSLGNLVEPPTTNIARRALDCQVEVLYMWKSCIRSMSLGSTNAKFARSRIMRRSSMAFERNGLGCSYNHFGALRLPGGLTSGSLERAPWKGRAGIRQ